MRRAARPGQHARATVVRLRLRTLAHARRARRRDGRCSGAPSACATCASWPPRSRCWRRMFAISRYVLPLVERRDRGASAEEHVGSLLEQLPAPQLARDPRCELRTRQRRPHPDRPAGRCSRSRPRAIPDRCASGACTARRSARLRPSATRSSASRACPSSRCSCSAAPGSTGRWRGARACACCPRGC